MKRVQSTKSLSLISSKPMALLVFNVEGIFSFSDMIFKRINPAFLNIASDATRFFLYQKLEVPIVHHWHKYLFKESYSNFYSTFSNVLKKHSSYNHNNSDIPSQTKMMGMNQNFFESKNLISNSTDLRPSPKTLLNITFPSSVEIHRTMKLSQHKQHSPMYSHIKESKTSHTHQNQKLYSVNTPTKKNWSETKHLIRSEILNSSSHEKHIDIFNRSNSYLAHQFNLFQKNTHSTLLKPVRTKHKNQEWIFQNISMEKKLNQKASTGINLSTIIKSFHVNKPSTQIVHSNHNDTHNTIIPTELNYNNTDNTSVEIVYKKETIKQVTHTSHQSNNALIEEKNHMHSQLNIINGISSTSNYQNNIESSINNIEKRVIQKINSNVMAEVEAKWSREIMRRGGDYEK